MILQRLREPDIFTFSVTDNNRIEVIERGPPVTLVADFMVSRFPELMPALLKKWGYRSVERRPEMRATQYVRPLPLWAIHKAAHAVYSDYWSSLHWLFRHRLIRIAAPDGTIVRFRDLRPWFMDGRGYSS